MHKDQEKTSLPAGLKRKIIIGLVLVMGLIAIIIGWLTVRSTDRFWTVIDTNRYSVRIPDGWTVSHFTLSDTIVDADCVSCITYRAGTKAKVLEESGSIGTEDSLYPFLLRPRTTGQKDEAAFFAGYEKVGTISAKNVTGNKYYKASPASTTDKRWGPHVTHGYAFTKGDNTIFITHTLGINGKDKLEGIERLIQTLELK